MNDPLDPIIPLTEDQQVYLRLRELERKRFEEHAHHVIQTNQIRRTNERQQFQERMQKCPVGLPPKRMSPRTPPPLINNDFKFQNMPTNSPNRAQQWPSNDQQSNLNKNSFDPSILPKHLNSNPLTLLNQQQLYVQQMAYQQNYISTPRLNHYQPYHYPQKQQQNNIQYTQFLQQNQANNGILNAQRSLQFNPMDYSREQQELARLQMMHYQHLQNQQQMAKNLPIDPKPNSQIETKVLNSLLNTPQNPLMTSQQTPLSNTPQNSTEKRNYWPTTSQYQQFGNLNTMIQSNFPSNPPTFEYQPMTPINFMPPTTQQNPLPSKELTQKSTTKVESVRNETTKNINGLKLGLPGSVVEEDDMSTLFSTLEEDSMEHAQMMEQYLDNIPDIQTCNFPQIPTNVRCPAPVDQRSTLNRVN